MPAKSLEALGMAPPKPLEAIARSMARDLAQHANGSMDKPEGGEIVAQPVQPVTQVGSGPH
jgi:hypothetical protein